MSEQGKSFGELWADFRKAVTPRRVVIGGMVIAGAMLFFPPHLVVDRFARSTRTEYAAIGDPPANSVIDWGRLAIQLVGLGLVAGALHYAVKPDA